MTTMTTTPAELATKLCPQMLQYTRPGEPVTPDVCCRGPVCAAWRWQKPVVIDELRRRGYCGLGGTIDA